MIVIYFLTQLKYGVEIGMKVLFDHCCKLMKYSDYFM